MWLKNRGDFPGLIFWKAYYFRIRIYGWFNKLVYLFCYLRGVKIGKNVRFLGFPIIRRYPNSNIILGNNCRFYSAKHSDLFVLLKPCTFVTLQKNSEIIFGNNVGVTGVVIGAASKVQIGNDVLIGANCTIIDTDFHNPEPNLRHQKTNIPSRPIIIEDNVLIGYNCLILKGVTIGKNSVIGANSVVVNSIPKNSIAIGNPCKLVIQKNWG